MAPRLFCKASVSSLRPAARGILVGDVGSSLNSVGTLEGGFKPEGFENVCNRTVSIGGGTWQRQSYLILGRAVHCDGIQGRLQGEGDISNACYAVATFGGTAKMVFVMADRVFGYGSGVNNRRTLVVVGQCTAR